MSEIITAGNPILKAVAAPVTSFDKKLKFLILDMKKTLYEANGVGLAAVISINNLISNFCEVKAYNVSIPKETRILSHYEFVKKYFIFDANYESDSDYKQLISDATTYIKEGENKHKKDAIDVLCAAANVIKKMYSEIIYQ